MDSYSHSDDECYGHDARAYSNGRSNIILQNIVIKHVYSSTHTPPIHTHTSPYMAKKEGEKEGLTFWINWLKFVCDIYVFLFSKYTSNL